MLKIRRHFITGLLIILPVFITSYFLIFIFKFIDGIFGSLVNNYLHTHFGFFIPGLGFILGGGIVLLTGAAASHFLVRRFLPAIEEWFLRLPGVRQIYPSTKQIISFIFSKEKTAFNKVVLVEYPSGGIWSIGFITGEGFKEANEKLGTQMLHVFVPSTPGPWSGFFVLIPKDRVKLLDLSVEDGIKLIVSGGILQPSA